MDENYTNVSRRLYDVLERVGASEEARKMYRDTATTVEIISTLMFLIRNQTVSIYFFGSSSEGTATRGLHSDTDTVTCVDDPLVMEYCTSPGDSLVIVRGEYNPVTGCSKAEIRKAADGDPIETLSRTGKTNPGYVVLLQCHNGKLDKGPNGFIFCRSRLTTLGQGLADEQHGPADTVLRHKGYKESDNVAAYRCKYIPSFYREWIGRQRNCGWPSEQLLSKMSSLGCLFVCVGHPSSSKPEEEWRVSFSLQERELMFSLNPTQHKCYILMKIIKKELISKTIVKSISSYHCKTCLFYAIENTSADIWRPNNLWYCLRLCLFVLMKCVFDGKCPNYFIKGANMFDGQEYSKWRNPVLMTLFRLLTDYQFLFKLKCDNVGQLLSNELLSNEEGCNTALYRQVDENKLTHEAHTRLSIIEAVLVVRNTVYTLVDGINDVRTLSNVLHTLTTTEIITEHTEQQTKKACSYLVPLVKLQLAQRRVPRALEDNDNESIHHWIHYFFQGSNFDLTTARLIVATFLFKFMKYDICEQVLDQVDKDVNTHVISSCGCRLKEQAPIITDEDLRNSISRYGVSMKTILETSVSSCVAFVRGDRDIVPDPLRFEEADPSNVLRVDKKYGWVVIDGKVYLYFLQYLVYCKLNKREHKHKATNKLKSVMKNDINLGHKETGSIILEWINKQEDSVSN